MIIESEQQYNAVLDEILSLMKIGEVNITDEQADRLDMLAAAAATWEDNH